MSKATSAKTEVTQTANVKALPSHRLYSVMRNGDEKSNWLEIGAAWPNKDGKGFSIKLAALPLPGADLVLREPKPVAEETE